MHPALTRRCALALGLLFSTLTGACGGGGGDRDDPIPTAAPGHWVVLGSSTAAGNGAPAGQGWVARLALAAAPLQVTVVNLARPGATTTVALTAGSAAGLEAALTQGPSLLLLSFPSNDAFAGLSIDASETNLQRLVDAGRRQGAMSLVLGRQPRHDLSQAKRDALAELDRRLQVRLGGCFVELYSGLAGVDGRLDPLLDAGDGIHLNTQGHALVQARVWDALQSGACVRLR